MPTFEAPSPTYLGPPFRDSGTRNKPIRRVVIHCTVSPCERGGARNIAAYFRSSAAGGSAHYVTDPGEEVQVGYDSLVCWHAPPNPNSLGVEMCDPMKGHGSRWRDRNHQAMLRRTAELTAALCLAYDVPIRRIDHNDLRAGKRGICGHDDVSDAWKQSTHWDPGPAFPWPTFMTMVRNAAARLRNEPVRPPTPEDTVKEHAVPSRVRRARRLLRRALKGADHTHRRRAIARALRELPKQ